ncbi:MAG TPA: hypothetical protein VHC97_07910 [Thermoanaerobaculia bacterium]|nr:hypothetical protein [Thermoanaerobaculia bacterium]
MAYPDVEEPLSGDSALDPDEYVYVKTYRNKAGKLMVAAHYGYQAWRFRVRKPKKQRKEQS